MSNKAQLIHEASMKILAEAGMRFHHPDAIKILTENGIRCEGNIAYFTEDQVMFWVKKAPAFAKLYAANPKYDMEIGGDNIYVGPASGTVFIADKEGNTRNAKMEDFFNLLKLYEGNEAYHLNGGLICQPCDIPAETTSILQTLGSLLHTEKSIVIGSGTYADIQTMIDLAAIRYGASAEELVAKPRLVAISNTNSSLQFDKNMTETLLGMGKYGQPVIITPAAMAGSTTPVTIAGTLAIVNAEVVATVALSQMANPGTPVVYGSQTSCADLASGAVAIGSPEGALCYKYCAVMAKYYGLPCRAGGALSDAKKLNAQAGYESMLTMMACRQNGVNLIHQSAGVMDSYLSVSYEKLIADFEVIDFATRYLRDIEVDEDTIPMDVIIDVAQDSFYLTEEHTIMNMRSEICLPKISVRGPGSNGATKLEANIDNRIEALYAAYKKPVVDEAIVAALVKRTIDSGIAEQYVNMAVNN